MDEYINDRGFVKISSRPSSRMNATKGYQSDRSVDRVFVLELIITVVCSLASGLYLTFSVGVRYSTQ